MLRSYILDDNGRPIPCDDVKKFAQWMEDHPPNELIERGGRAVGKTSVEGYLVSTVFLGMNHGFFDSAPVLFETMIINKATGDFSNYQIRYQTLEEAKQGHDALVKNWPADTGLGKQVNDNIIPQPAPQPTGEKSIWQLVIEDMTAREQFGIRKYGTPVTVDNGRDPLVDAYQEALDLCVYIRQAIEQKRKYQCSESTSRSAGL